MTPFRTFLILVPYGYRILIKIDEPAFIHWCFFVIDFFGYHGVTIKSGDVKKT